MLKLFHEIAFEDLVKINVPEGKNETETYKNSIHNFYSLCIVFNKYPEFETY